MVRKQKQAMEQQVAAPVFKEHTTKEEVKAETKIEQTVEEVE